LERCALTTTCFWDFDEPAGDACRDSSGHGYHASPERPAAFERIEGLFGGALRFPEHHKLQIPPENPKFGTLARLSVSAWVRPTELSVYREIFRKEDGDQRVLFSFQHDGTLLSLGLNIGGYIECDAKMDPAQVLDGQWHHCAGTFDGQFMRVYLDGQEIGALERPGEIVAGGPAPGCIGSSNGGECFQGAMDEVRIYADALTADEVTRLHRNGIEALISRCRVPIAWQ
jgi:hypothetical protein